MPPPWPRFANAHATATSAASASFRVLTGPIPFIKSPHDEASLRPQPAVDVRIGGAHITRKVIFPNGLIHRLDSRFPGQTWVVTVLDLNAYIRTSEPASRAGRSRRVLQSAIRGLEKSTCT